MSLNIVLVFMYFLLCETKRDSSNEMLKG